MRRSLIILKKNRQGVVSARELRSTRTRQFPTIFWCLLHASLGFLAAFLVVELAGPHNQVDQPT